MHKLYHGDCREILPCLGRISCIFADPPDGIGLAYGSYQDNLKREDYLGMFEQWLHLFVDIADTTWISFNAKWTFEVGRMVANLVDHSGIEAKACVQSFTFGQHRKTDLGNNHRPLWRLRWPGVGLYPEQIKEPSWRQLHGDRRAATGGRVPGDVLKFETCSRECLPLPNWSKDDIERFLEKIDKQGEDDCWEWLASCNGGYGTFRIGGRSGKVYKSTRLMWRLTHGVDPMGELVLHTCDNPKCCNPAHLFLDSDIDNAHDKESKGRGNHQKGEQQGASKLSTEDVIQIYQSFDSNTALSKQYGVGRSAIWSIKNKNTWTHVTNALDLTDVFNLPRVVGNSGQRRKWHPTQLHEGLVERCVKLSTSEGDLVCDPFAGTGTTLRVCNRINRPCVTMDVDRFYCEKISEENNLPISKLVA